ncbi:MAG: Tim44/TimA family putative adaptor protein [Reyranellaceae bacterium]
MNLPIDIILIALVAIFLVLQLRRVLGRRHGEERQRPDPFTRPDAAANRDDKVIDLPRREPADAALPHGADIVAKSGPAEAGLAQIRIADSGFDPRAFVQGARQAFEMIVSAYAQGDTKSLRPLLSDEVYERFAAAIRQRQDNKETLETGLVGFEKSEIVGAEMRGSEARVTLKFVTEQINVTRSADGLIVDGNPNEVTRVTDMWTFARDTKSSNPNWFLVATEEPAEG